MGDGVGSDTGGDTAWFPVCGDALVKVVQVDDDSIHVGLGNGAAAMMTSTSKVSDSPERSETV
jgi:hypothetical protein